VPDVLHERPPVTPAALTPDPAGQWLHRAAQQSACMTWATSIEQQMACNAGRWTSGFKCCIRFIGMNNVGDEHLEAARAELLATLHAAAVQNLTGLLPQTVL